MDITDVTAALTAAAPYSGAITALANLGIDITKAVTPDAAQNYENDHKGRITQAAELVSELLANPGDVGVQQRLNAFDDGMCAASGYPVAGGVAEQTITIRVDRYLAHVAGLSAGIYTRELLGEVTLGAKPGVEVATAK